MHLHTFIYRDAYTSLLSTVRESVSRDMTSPAVLTLFLSIPSVFTIDAASTQPFSHPIKESQTKLSPKQKVIHVLRTKDSHVL